MAEDIAVGAEGVGFDSRVGQIEHSIANGSPLLLCFFEVMLLRRLAAGMDPVSRYSLGRNAATVMKI